MSKPDDNSSPAQEKPAHLHRTRWVRFLRGLGWTVLGLVALIIILAILGTIIPPPRDPKAASLENEDFGLGFKVGDKWNLAAFDTTMKQNHLEMVRDEESERTVEAAAGGFPFTNAYWDTPDSCIHLTMFSQNKRPKTVVESIMLDCYNFPKDWDRAKRKALYAEAKKLYPDQESQMAYISILQANEAVKRHPQFTTAKGMGISSNVESFVAAYGKPDVRFPQNSEYAMFITYFRDKQAVTLFLSKGIITSVTIFKYPFPAFFGRLNVWISIILSDLTLRPLEQESASSNQSG